MDTSTPLSQESCRATTLPLVETGDPDASNEETRAPGFETYESQYVLQPSSD